jgi:hypothetical protein
MSKYGPSEAYELGVKIAAGYKLGDLFLGARPEAAKLGITGGEDWTFFYNGYLDALPKPIVTDHENRLIEIGDEKAEGQS